MPSPQKLQQPGPYGRARGLSATGTRWQRTRCSESPGMTYQRRPSRRVLAKPWPPPTHLRGQGHPTVPHWGSLPLPASTNRVPVAGSQGGQQSWKEEGREGRRNSSLPPKNQLFQAGHTESRSIMLQRVRGTAPSTQTATQTVTPTAKHQHLPGVIYKEHPVFHEIQ